MGPSLSSLSLYLCQLVEGAAIQQIMEHLRHNSLLSCTQSAYRQFYSTETALLRIKSVLLMAMYIQKVTLLLLMDLSSAFDTIDHSRLLEVRRKVTHSIFILT